ncbi:capsule biosynthesis GfcC family protein [Rheinheimera sp. NSM]|uniref:capsule biosynthesis GfcC family protein n=1 Tax=Rheinheimera sp. NSM TaxID=3457884 RepID=UPI0040371DEB
MIKLMDKALFCGAALLSCVSQAQVTVQINGADFQFAGNPRLSDVLAPAALQAKWYWPASALYKLNSNQPVMLQQQLLKNIIELRQQYAADSEVFTALVSVERQVEAWQLAERVAIPMDYDFARLRPGLNPRFDNGNYLLKLQLRPQVVHVFGAVQRAVAVTHQSSAAVSHYLPDIERSNLAADHEVIILQPDGSQLAVGVAYWNQQHVEVMPGAQLFIPFKAQLFSREFARLNEQLEQLAMHRILP